MDGARGVPPGGLRTAGRVRGRFVVTRLHHSGVAPHRVLLVGGRALLAPVDRAQSEALGQRLSDRLWLETQRGVDVDMVWELRPVLLAIRDGLSAWRLWRYDAVVIVTALRQSTLAGWWRGRGVGRLLRRGIGSIAVSSHVLVVSFVPDAGRGPAGHGRGDGRLLHLHGKEVPVEGVSVVSVPSEPRAAASVIAQHLARVLAAADGKASGPLMDAPHRQRLEPDDESGRQGAVDRLGLAGRQLEQRLQHVVDLAREVCETPVAEISIVDGDRRWVLAATGRLGDEMPRETSLCNRSIQHRGPTVIGDTWQDPSLRGNPLVSGLDPVRFYASHPIESLDGFRIGTLCVWDGVPRAAEEVDVAALRDLALLAEAEIISADRTG